MRISVLNFAQKHLQNINCCVHSMQMLKIFLEHGMLVRKSVDVFEDSSIGDSSSELKGVESSLKEILNKDEPNSIVVRVVGGKRFVRK